MSWTNLVEIITAGIGAFAFGILFNLHGKKLVAVSLGGAVGWLLVILLMRLGADEPTAYFIVALLLSLYAETLARTLKAPTTVFIIPSLIPLVPGSSLYYTMAYGLSGEKELFSRKAFATLALAAALAIGIIIATVLTRLFLRTAAALKARKMKRTENKTYGNKKEKSE